MPMDEERREYLKEYRKNCLKRIPIDVSFDFYADIKEAAEIEELSVSRYVKRVLEDDIRMKRHTMSLRRARNGQNVGENISSVDTANKVEYEKEFIMTPNGKQVIYRVKRQ